MKKLIILFIATISLAAIAYASSSHSHMGWSDGSYFLRDLNLDEVRNEQVKEVLLSYRDIGNLYRQGKQEQIPEFLDKKEQELAAILTPEELATLKNSFEQWAKKKDFSKFMKFSQAKQHANH